MIYDVIIVGSGPAGTNAAIYSGNAGLNALLITGIVWDTMDNIPGGLINKTDNVPNYLGLPNITGSDLGEKFIEHAEIFSTLKYSNVIGIEKENIFILKLHDGEIVKAKTIILATGSYPKKLGIEGEESKKVSYCAICDGFMYRNKSVAVVGGGNSALEEVEYLASISTHVYLIHRKKTFRAFESTQKRVEKLNNVTFILEEEVVSIEETNDSLTLSMKNQKLEVNGLFIAIGYEPKSSLFYGDKNSNAEILVDDNFQTSEEGIWAVGDLIAFRNGKQRYKQAIVAAAEGCIAALNVASYLKKN